MNQWQPQIYILRTCGWINYGTEICTLENREYTKLTRIVQNMRDTVSSVCYYKKRRYVPQFQYYMILYGLILRIYQTHITCTRHVDVDNKINDHVYQPFTTSPIFFFRTFGATILVRLSLFIFFISSSRRSACLNITIFKLKWLREITILQLPSCACLATTVTASHWISLWAISLNLFCYNLV